MNKYLYCDNCKEFPNKIVEKYLEPIEEVREFNTDCYELIETNLDSVEFEQLCFKCRNKLKEVEQ
jgi:hypothetical protein